MTHCENHGVFHRGCEDCIEAVRDEQMNEMLLDREADHDQDHQDQGQDRFASCVDQDDDQDDSNGVLTNRGYVESGRLDTILEIDLDG